MDRDRNYNSPTVLLTAYTGKAAYNISGKTLHSAFHLPINSSTLSELSLDVANSMAVALSDLKVLIIGEISMVSGKYLRFIDTRLQKKIQTLKLFGGKHVIFFLDFSCNSILLVALHYTKPHRTKIPPKRKSKYKQPWNCGTVQVQGT